MTKNHTGYGFFLSAFLGAFSVNCGSTLNANGVQAERQSTGAALQRVGVRRGVWGGAGTVSVPKLTEQDESSL